MTDDLLESITVPLIFKATVWVSAFEVTVIVFRIGLTRFVSYFTSISPFSPGKIGSVGFLGTVHPQLDFTFDTIKGASPVFLNLKTRTPSDPFSIVP